MRGGEIKRNQDNDEKQDGGGMEGRLGGGEGLRGGIENNKINMMGRMGRAGRGKRRWGGGGNGENGKGKDER